MEIYFDGYCPESLLQGKKVNMRLNEDDFWESEATGLQISVFPPFACILRWRGKGRFRQSSAVASQTLSGLIMTTAQTAEGKEIFPDEKNLIENQFDLTWYLDDIYDSKEAFEAARFNPNDPIFAKQEAYLNSIPMESFRSIVQLFDTIEKEMLEKELEDCKAFQQLHKLLYELKLIFDFKWMTWHHGWENLNDTSFDFSNCSLLDLSMYLTAIFRSDRFNDGVIEEHFRNGVLKKIVNRLSTVVAV
jgi:hypothetical protein